MSAERAVESRPEIQVNGRQLLAVVTEAWDALLLANDPPTLFRKGHGLARKIDTATGSYVLPVSRAALFGLLIRAADWMKATPKGPVAARPPAAVVADMLRFPDPRLPDASD